MQRAGRAPPAAMAHMQLGTWLAPPRSSPPARLRRAQALSSQAPSTELWCVRRRSAAAAQSRLDATWRYVIASPAAGGALHLPRSRRACGDNCMLPPWLTLAVAQAQPRFGSSAWFVPPGSPTHAAAGGAPSGPPVACLRCAAAPSWAPPVTSAPATKLIACLHVTSLPQALPWRAQPAGRQRPGARRRRHGRTGVAAGRRSGRARRHHARRRRRRLRLCNCGLAAGGHADRGAHIRAHGRCCVSAPG